MSDPPRFDLGGRPDMTPVVKICGLTDAQQARACAAAGAWGIGLVFAPSARRVRTDAARKIIRALPEHVARVGVFVDPEVHDVRSIVKDVGLTHIQVHGRFDLNALRDVIGLPIIEAVRVSGKPALARAAISPADLVLLDAAVPGSHGGTGTPFDWALLEECPLARRIGVAGGLRAANVGDVVRRLNPVLLDVSSGVECAPGQKDPARVAEFFGAVEAACAPG